MAGVDKSGLEITVDNGELTIVGHRHTSELTGEPVYREIRNNDFRRVYELDPAIDTAKISARIEQGILTLTLPKTESVRPRKITVDKGENSKGEEGGSSCPPNCTLHTKVS